MSRLANLLNTTHPNHDIVSGVLMLSWAGARWIPASRELAGVYAESPLLTATGNYVSDPKDFAFSVAGAALGACAISFKKVQEQSIQIALQNTEQKHD